MATGVSKAEYLKRYLSGEDVSVGKKKKKKKPKPVAKLPSSRIVDDDDDSAVLLPENLSNTLEEDVGDEEPTIADFIDERPEDVKQMEVFRNENKWKVITEDSPSRRTRYDSESDESPLRNPSENVDQGSAESDQSPKRRRRCSDSDQSPPRESSKTAGERHDSDSDSDQSPSRKSSRKSRLSDVDWDQSPPRKTQRTRDNKGSRYSNLDQSPPRRSSKKSRFSEARRQSDSDQSPPRKSHKTKDSRYPDSDQSPPRRSTKKSRFSEVGKHSDSDQSPPRKQQRSRDSKNRRQSDSDQSPPRRSSKKSRFSDARRRSDFDQSPPRMSSKKSRFSDARGRSDSDQSPPRNSSKMKELDQKGRASKTLSGQTAGLQSAKAMREEAERLKRRENESFQQISDDRLGRNAGTVFRDKSGKRRNFKEEKRKEREEEAKKAEQVEKYAQWGKGLKQQVEQDTNVASALHEMSKPLARYKDDKDLDEEMKAQDREGDPMLAFIKKKKGKTSSGPAKPRYNGPRQPPPNRFGIWPGYRWDGVDRSNGFEKQFFAKKAEKKAVKEMAYKWSVEDM